MLSGISLGVRALQIAFAIVIIGLSISLRHRYGLRHRASSFSIFIGAYGMVAGAFGILAVLLDSIPIIASMVADCIGVIIFAAAGIWWSSALKGTYCLTRTFHKNKDWKGFCRRAVADETFLFLGMFTLCILLVLGYLQGKRKGPRQAGA